MLKHAFHTVATRYLVTIILLLQSSLWTRLLTPEGRGLYAKLQAGQNLLILVLGLGLTSGIVYFSAGGRMDRARLWSLSSMITIGSTLIAGVFLLADHHFGSDFLVPHEYDHYFFIFYFLLSFIMTQIQLTMNAFLAADLAFGRLNKIELWSSSLRLIFIAAAFVAPRDQVNLSLLFFLDFFAHTIKTIFYFKAFRGLDIKTRLAFLKWQEAKPVLSYSFALYLLYVVQFMHQRMDIWLIERWNGLAQLGIFASAVGLAQYLTILPMALNTVLTPHLSRADSQNPYRDLQRLSRVNASILIFPVLIFGFFPGQILGILFGSSFVSAATPLKVLALAYWFSSVKHVFTYFNATQNRLGYNLMIESMAFFLGVALNLLWIPRYGINGAAYAYLCTSSVSTVLSYLSILWFAPTRQMNFFILTLNDLKTLIQALKTT